MQIITVVLSLAAAIGGYIFKLRSEIENHQNTIAQLQTQVQSQEFQKQITEVTKRVQESTIDFNDAANQFVKQYGDGSEPNTPTGSSTIPNTKSVQS